MKPIIKVDNLGKQYRVGTRSGPYTTLRETIHNAVRSPSALIARNKQNENDLFWALRDVSFEVIPGEIIGIIGSNGAGKSTLLKILARVTEPTRGRVELLGRVNCLLEVGTGFHQELTGRENIFVNGAILGLKNAEIKRLFDEIVAFAGIEKFLDTAVKHYSSGMYMRLAFSVAAHLNPDILIIDEVLSVGDAQFQKKSLGKVHEIAESGRTVIFVSHNMAAIENLCRRGVVLRQGSVSFVGTQTDAISHYLNHVGTDLGSGLGEHTQRAGSGEVRVTSIEIKDANGRPLSQVLSGQDIEIHFQYETLQDYSRPNVVMGFMVRTSWDVPVFLQHNRLTRDDWNAIPSSGSFVCRIKKLPLPPASYRLGLSVLCEGEYLDRVDDAGELNVVEGDFFGSGEVPPITHGTCLVEAEWRLSK